MGVPLIKGWPIVNRRLHLQTGDAKRSMDFSDPGGKQGHCSPHEHYFGRSGLASSGEANQVDARCQISAQSRRN